MPILTSSGGQVITVPATLPSTAAAGPTTTSIGTLTADDGNGHPSGLPVAALPSQEADLLAQLFARSGECPHSSTKKRQETVDYTKVGAAGAFVMPMAGQHDLLKAFYFAASSRLPTLVDDAAQASWQILRDLADTLPGYEDMSPSLRDTVTSGVWQSAKRWCIDGLNVS